MTQKPRTSSDTASQPADAKADASAPGLKVRKSGRWGGLRAVGGWTPSLADPILKKRGFVESRVIRDWPAIIGETLAECCVPTAIVFPRGRRSGGALELRVTSGRALEVQHREPLILERVNSHFGWPAVERIKIRQGPLPARPASSRRRLRALDPSETDAIEARLQSVDDTDLRARLKSLGEAIRASRPLTGR